jgi:DNA-binding PadR family transcriptional regulator
MWALRTLELATPLDPLYRILYNRPVSPRHPVNITYPTALVLQAIAHGHRHGFDIMNASGLPSGTVYPILRRLDHEGFLESAWEPDAVAHREQRPPRRCYAITAPGEALLAEAVQRYRAIAAVPRAVRRLRPSRT